MYNLVLCVEAIGERVDRCAVVVVVADKADAFLGARFQSHPLSLLGECANVNWHLKGKHQHE